MNFREGEKMDQGNSQTNKVIIKKVVRDGLKNFKKQYLINLQQKN